jgi:glycogen(starch) synthase
MVLLEAMGAGVPVVSTDVGGIPDVLRPPTEGWLVAPEDPTALAAAIDEALGDADRRAAVADAGRARIHAEFDLAAWVARHDEVYRSAIAVSAAR